MADGADMGFAADEIDLPELRVFGQHLLCVLQRLLNIRLQMTFRQRKALTVAEPEFETQHA